MQQPVVIPISTNSARLLEDFLIDSHEQTSMWSFFCPKLPV